MYAVPTNVCRALYVTPFDGQEAVLTATGGGDGGGGGRGGGDGGSGGGDAAVPGAGGAAPKPVPVSVQPLVDTPFDRLASCARLSATEYTCRSANKTVLLAVNMPEYGLSRLKAVMGESNADVSSDAHASALGVDTVPGGHG